MDLHPKKKIEVVVETTMVKKVLETMRSCDATGATVLPILSGEGQGGPWSDNDLGSALDMKMVMVVTGPRRAAMIRDAIYDTLENYRYMLLISDVEVIRNDRF